MNTDEHRWINTDFKKDLGKIKDKQMLGKIKALVRFFSLLVKLSKILLFVVLLAENSDDFRFRYIDVIRVTFSDDHWIGT